jgi:hypothetical protein
MRETFGDEGERGTGGKGKKLYNKEFHDYHLPDLLKRMI